MPIKKKEYSGEPEDLSEYQTEVLNSFRTHLVENNINDPYFDDWFLLKFCRACRFNQQKTIKKFTNYLVCHKAHLKNLLQYDFSNIESVVQKNSAAGFTGLSKEGLPVNVEIYKNQDFAQLAKEISIEEWTKYIMFKIETQQKCIFPYCSKLTNKRIDRVIHIIDLDGCNISPFVFNSDVREYLNVATKIGQDYYPESMSQTWIINSPMIFSVLWSFMKVWLDEKTKNKIKIYGSGFKKDLQKVIDADNLPDFLGGNVKNHPQNRLPWSDYVEYCIKEKTFQPCEDVKMGDPVQIAKFNSLDPKKIAQEKVCQENKKIDIFEAIEDNYFDEKTNLNKILTQIISREGSMIPNY